MIAFVENWVLSAGALGALGFFVGAVLEEVAFPFPSPLLLIGVAFFFGKPLSLLVIGNILVRVILPIVSGATVGSLIIYGIAYKGGKSAIDRFGKRLKISWHDVEEIQQKLATRKSDEWVLFLSRVIPFSPTTLVTVLAGIVQMNPLTYTILTFMGIFIRVTGLFVGAFLFGNSFFH